MSAPAPPAARALGQVRRCPTDGTLVVCHTADPMRVLTAWRVIGTDPHQSVSYGWRSDVDVADLAGPGRGARHRGIEVAA